MIVGAIDIGGTKIAIGLVDDSGQVLAKDVFPTAPELGLGAGIQHMAASLQTLCNRTGVHPAAIGIGCTGPVDPRTGILGPNDFLPGWEAANLIDAFNVEFGVRVGLENDADAAALAEAQWGSGQGRTRFIYLTISTGIGAGILLDGRLYRGVAGAHPEIGHHTIDPSGPLCNCGMHGCWESLASGPALASWFNEQAQQAPGTGAEAALPALDTRQVCELADAGHPLALRAVRREAYYLGLGIANLVSLFTPETIALGGGVMKRWELFEPEVRRIVRESCGLVPHEKTELVLASMGVDTGLAGAACIGLRIAQDLIV
jgi:glucokinase